MGNTKEVDSCNHIILAGPTTCMETLPTSECANTKTDEIKMTMAVGAYRRDPVLVICYGLLYKKKKALFLLQSGRLQLQL